MNQFLLQHGNSKELQEFSHIIEFGLKKNTAIQFNSLNAEETNTLRIYYILEGRFEWIIGQQHYTLYPDDLVLILPGHMFGGERGVLDIGTLCWIHVQAEIPPTIGKNIFGKWSNLGKNENQAIGKLLLLNNNPVLSKMKEAGVVLNELQHEVYNQQIGYSTRVNQLIDELFVLIARKLTHQNNSFRDFPQTFLKLEETLRENLEHQWTVEEMAALVGLGTTSFTEKVKNYTGFSPLNYLITIRISEAIRLLKKQDMNVTEIALETGFYSSQHFSTTFKKLTGYTPSEFRKKNISKN
jgi:AraC-like DNA-binding protein